jgi:hypothetical protein
MPSPMPPTSAATTGTRANAPSIVTSGNGSSQVDGTISACVRARTAATPSGSTEPSHSTWPATPRAAASARISVPCGSSSGPTTVSRTVRSCSSRSSASASMAMSRPL